MAGFQFEYLHNNQTKTPNCFAKLHLFWFKFCMKITILLCTIVAFTTPLNVFAKNIENSKRIDEYFELLSYEKTDFEPVGAVCERVAVREVEPMYPSSNYEIKNGIQYDEHKTTIGELDVVVFDKSTGKVEAIAEVKCWKSFQGALKKAKEQRMRFLTYLNKNIIITDKDEKKYSKDVFKSIQKYFSISQDGGVNQGFDFELSLDIKELMELRKRLLDCRAEGRCPRR